MQDGCTLGRLATVSWEWRTELERHNFARIKLTPVRLVDFSSIIHRNRALVGYIWFCLELDNYDCTVQCSHKRSSKRHLLSAIPITVLFQNLFSILSTWDLHSHLTLDVSIYSSSDSERWFKYLTFMPDTPLDVMAHNGLGQAIVTKVYNDLQHGCVTDFRHPSLPRAVIRKNFQSIMDEGPFDTVQLELQWWDQLPSVPAVSSLLLRQQNRRRWRPSVLAHMFARFPRLQEVHYEPWREWDIIQLQADRGEYCCKPAQVVACSHCISTLLLIIHIRWLDFKSLFKSNQRFNSRDEWLS